MKIIFIHGRSQENKDPIELQADWTKALLAGFSSIGKPYTQPLDIEFPYYGDELFREAEENVRRDFTALLEKGVDDDLPGSEQEQFIRDVVLAVAEKNGISHEDIQMEAYGELTDKGIQNWRSVLTALRILDRIPGISASAVELFTRDVWIYLTARGARGVVHQIIDAVMPTDQPCVVVGHSLGSVVAYNAIMNRQHRSNVLKLITLGSPLGIDAIYSRLPSDTSPRRSPWGVNEWFNARDKRDVVALYEIPKTNFSGTPVVSNYSGVKNTSENRHGIAQYLQDPKVAEVLRSALD